VKNNREKLFGPWPDAAHGLLRARPAHCAADTISRPLCGPARCEPLACQTRSARCWPSDEIQWFSASVAGSKRTQRPRPVGNPSPSAILSLYSVTLTYWRLRARRGVRRWPTSRRRRRRMPRRLSVAFPFSPFSSFPTTRATKPREEGGPDGPSAPSRRRWRGL
jgi:hypothetical protein